MRPNEYNLTTDYGTLKNDTQTNTIQITIPSGTTYPYSNPIIASTTLNVGTINAGIRARANSSKYPTIWTVGSTLYSDLNVTVSGSAFDTTLYCNLDRISPTTVRLQIATDGAASAPNATVNQTQTITFVFSTFLSPLD